MVAPAQKELKQKHGGWKAFIIGLVAFFAYAIIVAPFIETLLTFIFQWDWRNKEPTAVRLVLWAIGILIGIAAGYIAGNALYKKNAPKAEATLQRCEQDRQTQMAAAQHDLVAVRQAYAQRVAPWYPPEYSTAEAASFMSQAVRLGRADTLGAAINLYETHMHEMRMEDNQRQQIALQKVNNALSVMQIGATIFAGSQVAGSVDRNTDAVNTAGSSVTNAVNTAGSNITSAINNLRHH
ncbi:hypothetical protein OZX67_09300 [Bifidobacterium sp. ESL0728]|uniref:hypothetical protein n=1 Tax=Bifidobacterium sp. ESL0728 TaxID=2983220 RepID=UPI0023F6E44A|nr:hypothetical protein [Bifidobacterium sp. ESL0728]WEV58962.1 hypothetical protein OZX67_09300 [Bifidobacterium sp. ESL0728]